MIKDKKNIMLSIIWSLTCIFLALGATFSYFTSSASSNAMAVSPKAFTFQMNLNITPIYNNELLIPLDDTNILVAYENECIDIYGYGACQAYNIEIENISEDMEYDGTIKFTINNIQNLKYIVLDENDNVYIDKTEVIPEVSQNIGENIQFEKGESKQFKLLIWVPNYNYNQNNEDSNGYFDAIITYESTNSNIITGSISG